MLPEVIPKGKKAKEAKAKQEGWEANLTKFIYLCTNFNERRWLIRDSIERFGVQINHIWIYDPNYMIQVSDLLEVRWYEYSIQVIATSKLIKGCN